MSHIRRQDRAITDPAEIDRILSAAKFATVALTDGDEPYAVTLSCGYDRDRRRLCFHVAREGRKLDIISANPRACASVVADLGYETGECAHAYESVVMVGRMRVLDDPDDIRVAMRTLIGQLESAEDGEAVWERNKLDTPGALNRFRSLVFEIDSAEAKRGQ